VAYARKILEQIGLEGDRVAFYNLSSAEGSKFAQIASDLTERVRALGPSPLRRK